MENSEKTFAQELFEETEVKTALKKLVVNVAGLCNKLCSVAEKELEVREERLIIEKRNVIRNSDLPTKEQLETEMALQRNQFDKEEHNMSKEKWEYDMKIRKEEHEVTMAKLNKELDRLRED